MALNGQRKRPAGGWRLSAGCSELGCSIVLTARSGRLIAADRWLVVFSCVSNSTVD